jgi:hypothetical protein
MTQLSLFSADLAEPQVADLGGLLATHGQIAQDPTGARLSVLLDAAWRAEALLRECRVRDVPAEMVPVLPGQPAGVTEAEAEAEAEAADPSGWAPSGREALVRTARSPELRGIATAWTRGAVKAVPDWLEVNAGLLRCWVLAAGRSDEAGFLLGLDPHAPDTYEPLAAACARAGIAGSLIGVRGGGPGIRVVGYRRISRLAELLGSPPLGAPRGVFPSPLR